MSFVDAHTGKVLLSYNNLHTGRPQPPPPDGDPATGTGLTLYAGTVALGTEVYTDGTYGMKDPTRGGMYTIDMGDRKNGGTLFTDADNTWGDFTESDRATAGADAHFGAALTWDYYLSVHGRNGVYDDGAGVYSRVHYGRDYNNAYWSDSCKCMTYGDGDGSLMSPLVAIDIAAHEMTHGVTSATADLVYTAESGGLNESMSDIFATAVEFYAEAYSSQVGDYLIGEDVWTPGTPGDALRYMDHPSLDGRSIDHYSQYSDSIDVHYSSGLANNVFYLMCEGGTNDTSGMSVTPIGLAKAEKVFYRALTVYMTSGTTFAEARTATIQAANDLYDSSTASAVAEAWTACGVN
jgi:Zn-dependent metalloprotease